MASLDYIEVFYRQGRRHSTLGQIRPATLERRATQAAQLDRPPNRINLTFGTAVLRRLDRFR
jgi:hypothetical protein